MFAIEVSIEIEQGITEAQHRAIGRLRGEPLGRYKSYSTHYILSPLTDAIAGRLWEYLCEERVKTTLVRETRITFDPHTKGEVATADPLGPAPPELADAWERYQHGGEVAGWELSKLDEWRDDRAREEGF